MELYKYLLKEKLHIILEMALAWSFIDTRTSEAHEYCITNNVGLLGNNIWHAILDDAKRMRRDLEQAKSSK